MATAERRIILLGNTGNGKSSTGNSLLGSHEFAECRSPQPVTQHCQFRKSFNDKRQMSYTIVDTPGFMCTDDNLAEHLLEIQKSIVYSPEPHAFLLVFSPSRQLNEDDRIFDLLRVAFGEQVFNHCIVVFTHGNFFNTDEEFTEHWQTSNMLLKLVDRCGGRVIRIKNETSTDLSPGDDVDRIYDNVEKISDSGRNIYSFETIQKHKNVLQECMVRNKGSRYMQQITTLVHDLGFKKQAMERRIILIGKTGNGKRSTGNTLLGSSVFQTGRGLTAVTQRCQFRTSYNDTNNMRYIIVDTPGLMDTDVPLGERLLEILRSVEICPEPHAFLLIFSSINRLTKDEEYTIDLLRVVFGENVFDHCIVVFTYGNDFNSDQEFTSFWKESPMMCKLVERCGSRITKIENRNPVNQGNAITALIETMSDKGNKMYRYPDIVRHREVMQTHIDRYDGTRDLQNELSVLVHALGKVLSVDMWNVMLVGGTIITLSALGVGAGYVVYLAGGAALAMASSGNLGAALKDGARSLARKAKLLLK